MTLHEAGIQEWSLVVLKLFGDRQTLRQRLFRIRGWLSPEARGAGIGVWPGDAIFGTYVLDGLWGDQSTADIERLASDADLRAES
jgi:hypothetical protein